jgi:hypothetical protein
MSEPLPAGVEGRRIGNRHPLMEIIAAGWLRYVDGDLATGACQVLLVRGADRTCEHAGSGNLDHPADLLLEYQVSPPAGRVWLCLECVLDALETGEFTSLEWTHRAFGQLIPTEWRV